MAVKIKSSVAQKVLTDIVKSTDEIPKSAVPAGVTKVKAPVAATATITDLVSGKVVGEESKSFQELVSVPAEHALVNVKLGTTVNTGDYNSVRLDVGITLPCSPDNVDDTFTFSSAWVGEKLEILYGQYISEPVPK